MTLEAANIKFRPGLLKSSTVPAQNGGRMAYLEVVSGVKNNLFPDASPAQRAAGLTQWRKLFVHIDHDSTTALNNVRTFMDQMTGADDYWLIQPATATGTQATDADEAALYGVGALATDVLAGVETITVTCEHADYETLLPFRVGMLIRVSDIPPGGDAGNEEFVTLTGVSITGADAALTFIGSPLANGYSAAATLVSGVIETASVSGSFGSVIVTSAAGAFDTTNGNLTVPSKGSVDDSFALNFITSTTFSVVGTVAGVLAGTGSIGADYSAINPSTGTAFFSILSTAWSGSFSAGDTVTFNTFQASLAVFIRQRIPAGAGSLQGNVGAIKLQAESA